MAHELLKEEITKKRVYIKEIAEALGVTPQCVTNKLSGKSDFYVGEAYKVLELLGLNESDIHKFFCSES